MRKEKILTIKEPQLTAFYAKELVESDEDLGWIQSISLPHPMMKQKYMINKQTQLSSRQLEIILKQVEKKYKVI